MARTHLECLMSSPPYPPWALEASEATVSRMSRCVLPHWILKSIIPRKHVNFGGLKMDILCGRPHIFPHSNGWPPLLGSSPCFWSKHFGRLGKNMEELFTCIFRVVIFPTNSPVDFGRFSACQVLRNRILGLDAGFK